MGNFVLNPQKVLSSFSLLSLGENCLQCLGTPNLTNFFLIPALVSPSMMGFTVVDLRIKARLQS